MTWWIVRCCDRIEEETQETKTLGLSARRFPPQTHPNLNSPLLPQSQTNNTFCILAFFSCLSPGSAQFLL